MEMSDSKLDATVFGISLLVLSVGVAGISILINGFLPESQETIYELAPTYRFNSGRVFKDLEELSDIGPKVTGTIENEVLAVEFLIRKIENIVKQTNLYANKIEYDVQQVSGCWAMEKVYPRCYHNIQNVIVKLTPLVFNVSESILLNCHFDSMPMSPGTSDDGLHCSVMLEIIRVLLAKDEPLMKPIIFLFNGAEEQGLLGSHGFIKNHKWSKNIACFINLESCGAGGREILFQTGPDAYILPKIYANYVPYPYGNVIGEELFQSGLLPSDTDFRIFRDFGNLKGLDFAHFKNGYVYHTSSDDISHVSTNIIQHTGSNILALLQGLLEQAYLKDAIMETPEQAVFFDLFGQFMVCYKKSTAFTINLTVIVLSLVSLTYVSIRIFKGMSVTRIFLHVAINCTSLGFGIFIATGILFGLAMLVKVRGLTMLWYGHQWFAVLYYGMPTLFTIISVLQFRRSVLFSALSLEKEIYLFVIIIQMVVTLFAFILSLFQVRSVYVFVVGLLPLSISLLLTNTVIKNENLGIKILTYLAVNLIYFIYITYIVVPIFQLLIPMMGRIGSKVVSETIIWILSEICIILIFMYSVPVVLMVRKFWKVLLFVAVSYLVFAITVLYGSVLRPFEDDAPQRFEIMHVNRKIYIGDNITESSGFLLIPMEKRAQQTVGQSFKDHNFTEVTELDCVQMLYCGVPLSKYSRFGQNYGSSFWGEGEKPVLPENKILTVRTVSIIGGIEMFVFNVSGPEVSEFVVVPMNDYRLFEWSFSTGIPETSLTWQNETTYRFQIVRGIKNSESTLFWLRFYAPNVRQPTHAFKLSWSANYHPNNVSLLSPSFRKVISQFPSWTRVSVALSELEEYLFYGAQNSSNSSSINT